MNSEDIYSINEVTSSGEEMVIFFGRDTSLQVYMFSLYMRSLFMTNEYDITGKLLLSCMLQNMRNSADFSFVSIHPSGKDVFFMFSLNLLNLHDPAAL